METKIFMGGIGGQGVVMGGKMLAGAAVSAGLFATCYNEYAPAMRNGFTYSNIMVSHEEVGAQVTASFDCMVFFDEASCKLKSSFLKKEGGLYIINSTLVQSKPANASAKVYTMEVNKMADELGNVRLVNVLVLGGLVELLQIFDLKYMENVLKESFGSNQKVIDLNVKALHAGAACIKEQKGK